MKYLELLNEMIFEDRYAAGDAIKRHPNALIHFSNIPKLGINPKAGHKDTPGVYFYFCKWLLSEEASLSQYATTYPYYYIVKLKPTPNSINLGTVTTSKIEQIAKRNGWYDDMVRVKSDPTILNNVNNPMEKKLLRKPGGFFYACMDYLANLEKKNWLSMLKGVDVLVDPGFGIIAQAEAAQVVVLNPRIITIIEQGDNTDNADRNYADILKGIATEYSGKFYYKFKVPTLELTIDQKPIKVALGDHIAGFSLNVSYFKEGFWFTSSEKIDSSHGDVASLTRTINYFIKKFANEAETSGDGHYWDFAKASTIIKQIFPRAGNIKQYLRDGVYRISYGGRDWGRSTHISCTVSQMDELEVGVDIDFKDVLTIEMKKSFGDGDPSEIGQQLRQEIISEITKQYAVSVPNGDIEKMLTFLGINIKE